MGSPVWLDERGRQRRTSLCPRCGRDAPIFRFREEHLRLMGWRMFAVASFTNWCWHGQEFIPVPDADGWCWMIPVIGEAV